MRELQSERINTRPVSILLVDDDEGDVILTTKAFEKGKIANTINVASDGVEALQFLRGDGDLRKGNCPDLVLLDLNMPRKDGRETLEEMQQDPELRDIPVIVLTTSDADQHVVRDLGVEADFYITKPVNVNKVISVMRTLPDIAFSLVTNQV